MTDLKKDPLPSILLQFFQYNYDILTRTNEVMIVQNLSVLQYLTTDVCVNFELSYTKLIAM